MTKKRPTPPPGAGRGSRGVWSKTRVFPDFFSTFPYRIASLRERWLTRLLLIAQNAFKRERLAHKALELLLTAQNMLKILHFLLRLKYDTFCREKLKYGTFCQKNLNYALRAKKNGKFA